jgi:hypothetical protein
MKKRKSILVSDIESVRLVCHTKDCGGAVEIPFSGLDIAKTYKCSACGEAIASISAGGPFMSMAKILVDLKNHEFLLRGKEKLAEPTTNR